MEEIIIKIAKEWDYKGKKCVILFMSWGERVKNISSSLFDYYNGYVETSLTKTYNDKLLSDIEVHGGLTFGAEELPTIPALKGKKFFGFDTAHAFDKGIEDKNIEYMIQETEKLADQLIEIENRGEGFPQK